LKGKVTSFDPNKGVGKIFVANYGVKPFVLEQWKSPKQPEVGMEVEFELQNNKITNITTALEPSELFKLAKTPITYKLPTKLRIKEDVPLDLCLDAFFQRFINVADKFKSHLQNSLSLPYKKVKRFILTAFHNLVEIDANINNNTLHMTYKKLEEIEMYHNALLKEARIPLEINIAAVLDKDADASVKTKIERLLDIPFTKIYLDKQTNYNKLKEQFEQNKQISAQSLSNAKMLEPKIEKLEAELLKMSTRSAAYAKIEARLKEMRKQYVDLIDKAQSLKEDNENIINDLREFRDTYRLIFIKFFFQKAKVLAEILEREMNCIAYEFDKILWDNSKKSRSIQNFFKEAKIEGSYSTKTFIKYYLKNLNEGKMNKDDIELLEIFDELSAMSENIVIYDKYRSRARELSLVLENLNHNCSVEIIDNFKEFILYTKQNFSTIKIVLVEIEDDTKHIVYKFLPSLKKLGLKVLLFSDTLQGGEIIPTNKLETELKKIF